MNTESLCRIADKNDIVIIYTDGLEKTSSCSIRQNNTYYIGINNSIDTSSNLNVHIAHELGHCLTGSMYNMYAPLDNRGKHELRADKWAIKKLIPFSRLCTAIQNGIFEIWDLAEYFNVTEEYIKKAITYYQENINAY